MYKEDDINKLLEITSRAGAMMLKNGAEIYRVEDTVERIIRSIYDASDIDVFATFNALMYSFNVDGKTYANVKRVKNRGNNLIVVDRVNSFSRKFCNHELNLDQALMELDNIKNTTKADIKLKIIGATLASTAFPLLVNSKAPNFLDLPVTFVVSLLTYLLFIKIEKKMYGYFIENFLAGIMVSLFAHIIGKFVFGFNMANVIVSSMMPYVPGFLLTNSIRDLMSGDATSGLTGLAMSFFVSLALAIGVAFPMTLF
ncbi:MAG: threonine/serine exporter family protein [Anaerococcus vaginalis]|uniref:threonine/serine ThrE exporter family protein n=1 Tax=Anaerococcus vaginalis TaxID=33037 RepID=UPI001D8B83DC|nr:threonine/serine exporter family protein [Anaerococcus vaginalis]MBS4888891.1 threonine/serine exporter family protein [Anaerococcus vaginalis]MDU5086199.1 threonine/serine exporter family protein [Anaerococcus vaginalis]MDU7649892.1 threonine/serine exporter family protein [Anaerococcus vaginalis]